MHTLALIEGWVMSVEQVVKVTIDESTAIENFKEFKDGYLLQIDRYVEVYYNAPQRAALLSAAVKKYKTAQAYAFLYQISQDYQIDLTPLAARRLSKKLFNRQGSQAIAVLKFGTPGREHRSCDSSEDRIEDLAYQFQIAAETFWAKTLQDIKDVKKCYKDSIAEKNAK